MEQIGISGLTTDEETAAFYYYILVSSKLLTNCSAVRDYRVLRPLLVGDDTKDLSFEVAHGEKPL